MLFRSDRDVERRIGIQAVVEHPWCLIEDESDEENDREDVVAALLDEKAQQEQRPS